MRWARRPEVGSRVHHAKAIYEEPARTNHWAVSEPKSPVVLVSGKISVVFKIDIGQGHLGMSRPGEARQPHSDEERR
jgi:hypothetical protein